MENRRKLSKFQIIVIALIGLQFLILGMMGAYLIATNTGPKSSGSLEYDDNSGKYILYIGTNDKDTNTQLIALDEAKEIVNSICIKHVSGYTVEEANGGWTDNNGTLFEEDTLIYSFSGVTEEAIIQIMDEAIVALNQASILVEYQNNSCAFYEAAGNP